MEDVESDFSHDQFQNYDPNSKMCIICYTKKKTMVIYPCGHIVFCQECGNKYKKNRNCRCPLCRVKVIDIISTFS